MNETVRTRWWIARAIVAFWLLYGLFNVSQRFLQATLILQERVTWLDALWFPLTQAMTWMLLTPLILLLVHRLPLESLSRPRNLVIALTATVAISAIKILIDTATTPLLASWVPERGYALLRRITIARTHATLFTCWLIAAVAHGIRYYQKYHERELRTTQLEARLAEAQLQVLRMQLHPHFLFNALNTIAALMRKDVDAAEKMLARLGDLLRLALSSSGAQEVPLKEELAFLKSYLEIEKIRFRNRLLIEIDAEGEVLDALVPNLILQPLVENAIRHGLAQRVEPGTLRITAHREGTGLLLSVEDDGPGLSAFTDREGIGLGNTRARLAQLFGNAHRFLLEAAPGGGLVVRLTIPFTIPLAEGACAS
jgi:two-component system, LytTR family, sensor kinase